MAEPENQYRPGEGLIAKVRVSLRMGNIRAVRKRWYRGFSACVDAVVERQIERNLLEEALAANEAEAGPIPQSLRNEVAKLFHDVKNAPALQEDRGRHRARTGMAGALWKTTGHLGV